MLKARHTNSAFQGLSPAILTRVQECLRVFEASKDPPQHLLEGGHHVITHIPHMEGMAPENVDPGHGHEASQLEAAPPLEQTYQHDALAHHMVSPPLLSSIEPQSSLLQMLWFIPSPRGGQ